MFMLEIIALDSGAHRNQTYNGFLPEGWALDKNGICVENFPFGEASAEEIDGIMTITNWKPLPIPEPEPEPEPTSAELREEAYNSEKVIEWEEEKITVTEAAQLWQYYAAEGNEKATILTSLISEAKSAIREKYPN